MIQERRQLLKIPERLIRVRDRAVVVSAIERMGSVVDLLPVQSLQLFKALSVSRVLRRFIPSTRARTVKTANLHRHKRPSQRRFANF